MGNESAARQGAMNVSDAAMTGSGDAARFRDAVTALPNRIAFDLAASRADRQARALDQRFAVILVTVADIGELNRAGLWTQPLLIAISEFLRPQPAACVARVGGDEWALLIEDAEPAVVHEQMLGLRDQLTDALRAWVAPAGCRVAVCEAIGPTLEWPESDLLWLARHRLDVYRSKAFGRDLAAAHEQASRDPLTGLLNRRGAGPALAAGGMTGALALVDLDFLRERNNESKDTYLAGDAALTALAEALARAPAELHSPFITDDPPVVVARWGGDEFLVRIPQDADRLVAALLAARSELQSVPIEPRVTFSAGVIALESAHGLTDALEQAGLASKRAKAKGRDRVERADQPGH